MKTSKVLAAIVACTFSATMLSGCNSGEAVKKPVPILNAQETVKLQAATSLSVASSMNLGSFVKNLDCGTSKDDRFKFSSVLGAIDVIRENGNGVKIQTESVVPVDRDGFAAQEVFKKSDTETYTFYFKPEEVSEDGGVSKSGIAIIGETEYNFTCSYEKETEAEEDSKSTETEIKRTFTLMKGEAPLVEVVYEQEQEGEEIEDELKYSIYKENKDEPFVEYSIELDNKDMTKFEFEIETAEGEIEYLIEITKDTSNAYDKYLIKRLEPELVYGDFRKNTDGSYYMDDAIS